SVLAGRKFQMSCELIHDREFLDANTTWDSVYRDPSILAEEKTDTIDRCCEVLDDRVTAHGSEDLPRPILAFCLNSGCTGWMEA
ncbi:MAG: hypothetical protein ACRDTT_30895, partial [Pseudonocardiaceae bacterium]